jgi:hypothetical protein
MYSRSPVSRTYCGQAVPISDPILASRRLSWFRHAALFDSVLGHEYNGFPVACDLTQTHSLGAMLRSIARTGLSMRCDGFISMISPVDHGTLPLALPLSCAQVTVSFSLQQGVSGMSLNTSADCPSVVLNVYCRRAQTLGFEVLAPAVAGASGTSPADSAWQAPTSVALSEDKRSVVVTLAAGQVASRVRYAYSDWPVVSLRNAEGGLPARLFDMPVMS